MYIFPLDSPIAQTALRLSHAWERKAMECLVAYVTWKKTEASITRKPSHEVAPTTFAT